MADSGRAVMADAVVAAAGATAAAQEEKNADHVNSETLLTPSTIRKQVRFDGSSSSSANSAESPQDRKAWLARRRKELNQKAKAMRRVQIGDGKPNLARDLTVFVGLAIMFLWLALSSEFGDSKRKDKKEKKTKKIPLADKMNELAKKISLTLMEKGENARRKDPCSIFVAPSTLPIGGNQRSLFAGRNYQAGEVVLPIPWFLPVHELDRKSYNVDEDLSLASYALFLKFHPTLFNVNGSVLQKRRGDHNDNRNMVEYAFWATKPIEPGDELFLPFDNHPASLLSKSSFGAAMSLFQYIPTQSDFQLADEITKLITNKARQMEVAHSRRLEDSFKRLETSYLYSLGQTIAGKFRPIVADLIPRSRPALDRRNGLPSHLSSLQNTSLSQLQIMASCLTDIATTTTGKDDEEEAVVVKSLRKFESNEIVHVMPIHIIVFSLEDSNGTCINGGDDDDDSESTCSTGASAGAAVVQRKNDYETRHCLSSPDSLVALCGLSHFAIQEVNESRNGALANVAIEWARSRKDNLPALDLAVAELNAISPGTLALQVKALKSIHVGDELRIDDAVKTAQELIPNHWKR